METDKKDLPVAGLVRVSTLSQAEDHRAGIARQHDVIQRTVAGRDLNCIKVVEVTDVSGTNVRNCPEIQGLLEDVRIGRLSGIVVADLDRLIRPAEIEDIALLQTFQDTGAVIFSGDQELDLSSDSGFLLGGIQALLAGHELRTIKRRMMGGKEEKRKQGKCPNSRITLPLGVSYDREKEVYAYNADVERVVEAFRLVDETGITNLSEIGRRVGIHHRTLANQLRNPIYMGWRIYNQKRGPKYPSRNGRQADRRKVARSDAEIIRVKVIDEPAVSEDRFARVQDILSSKNRSWHRKREVTPVVNLGVGVARCGICGERLYCSSGKRKNGKRHSYYMCKRNYHLFKKRTGGCQLPNRRQTEVDSLLRSFVADQLTDVKTVTAIVHHALSCLDHDTRPVAIATAESRAQQQRKKDRLLEAYEDGAIDLSTYKERVASIDAALKTATELQTQKEDRMALRQDRHKLIERVVRGAVAFSRIESADQQQTAMKGLFADISINEEGIAGYRLTPQVGFHFAQNGTRTDKGSLLRPA